MNRDQNIAAIRAACIKANPEIVELDPQQDGLGGFDPKWEPRPIRLADVLLAIDKADGETNRQNYCVTTKGAISTMGHIGRFYHVHATWNLCKDDLTEQSDECILFLYGLFK